MKRRASLAAVPKDEIPIANPGDYDDRKSLFLMWAGASSPLQVYVWADHFEDAFEAMVDFIDEHEKCGIFTFLDDSDYRAAARDAGIEWPAGEDFDWLSERDQNRVREAAEVDLSVIGHTTLKCQEGKGSAFIPSWEWGGDEIPPSSPDYKVVERACAPRTIVVTYEIVTPESAEEGDVEDSGLDDEIEVTYSDLDADEGETFAEYAAKMIAEELGYVEPDCSGRGCVPRWYTQSEPDQNRAFFERGEEKRRSMHFETKNGWSEEDRREIYADLKSRKMVS